MWDIVLPQEAADGPGFHSVRGQQSKGAVRYGSSTKKNLFQASFGVRRVHDLVELKISEFPEPDSSTDQHRHEDGGFHRWP